jgi:hypothetical protein
VKPKPADSESSNAVTTSQATAGAVRVLIIDSILRILNIVRGAQSAGAITCAKVVPVGCEQLSR